MAPKGQILFFFLLKTFILKNFCFLNKESIVFKEKGEILIYFTFLFFKTEKRNFDIISLSLS